MTNKSRKRRPGGGRKPSGPIAGKDSTLSTRITAETRGALEAEAAASGHSISQVAERLLQLGLEVKQDRKRDDPVRALAHVIQGLALHCRSSREDGTPCDWNSDPSMFEAFRLALGMLLERLRPDGEIDTSVEGPLVGSSPENHARYVFRIIADVLFTPATPRSPSELEAEHRRLGFRVPPAEAIAAMSQGSYALSDVQRALKIRFEETKP